MLLKLGHNVRPPFRSGRSTRTRAKGIRAFDSDANLFVICLPLASEINIDRGFRGPRTRRPRIGGYGEKNL